MIINKIKKKNIYMNKNMNNIINELTQNVNTNDDLVGNIVDLVIQLRTEKQNLVTASGESTAAAEVLETRIQTLQTDLETYKTALTSANQKLATTVGKLKAAIPPVVSDGDGKRRSRRSRRKRTSRRRKSRRSKKRHY